MLNRLRVIAGKPKERKFVELKVDEVGVGVRAVFQGT